MALDFTEIDACCLPKKTKVEEQKEIDANEIVLAWGQGFNFARGCPTARTRSEF